ncbi:MAG: MarR family transcriptional regulator [Dehalococcoidales bacterium]|nr:MarR family transcriptional regulator [Dehalococcoidales bacterium]
MDLGGVTGNLTRLHFAVMGVLSRGNMTVSELANILTMSKPQMTHLIDQLVNLGVVERHPDTADRRVINLNLTSRGILLRDEMKGKVKENIKNKLANLTPEELTEMSVSLETLSRIVSRL